MVRHALFGLAWLALALPQAIAGDDEDGAAPAPAASDDTPPVPAASDGTIANPADYAGATEVQALGREKGTVKWFNDAKGYGFITRESGPDIFVHHTDIDSEGFRSLSEGETVSFDVVKTSKGIVAKRVRRE